VWPALAIHARLEPAGIVAKAVGATSSESQAYLVDKVVCTNLNDETSRYVLPVLWMTSCLLWATWAIWCVVGRLVKVG